MKLIAIISKLFVTLCVLFLLGCKTVQVKEQINIRDSVVYQYRDSIRWQIRDSVRITEHHITLADSSHLIIQFGQGGGTYNAKTGEATNVANVQQTDTHNEQRDSLAHYRNITAEYQHTCDSLSEACRLWQSDYERAEKNARSSYDRFCSLWFWITAILLALKIACWIMEKIPTTAPYVIAIRKFIPFL